MEQGLSALERYECNRCHAIEGVDAPPLSTHCAGCHQQVMGGTFPAEPEVIAKWQARIEHFLDVPPLSIKTTRFSAAWLDDYLAEPHDLRPRLGEQMPRLAMKPADRAKIVRLFSRDGVTGEDRGVDVSLRERGEELFASKACGTCHVVGGEVALVTGALEVRLTPEEMARAMKRAPDVVAVSGRLARPDLVEWILDPEATRPGALMPNMDLTRGEALALAEYMWSLDHIKPRELSIPKRPAVLKRRVTYKEVERDVFKKVCWHCHSEGAYVGGDGGPGNTGGFGFKGRRLSLAEYGAISSGMLDTQGTRVSVFREREDGTPWIVAAMHARYAEIAGEPIEGIRGMPLGLPPMTLEEIQLVESWIAQGRPKE